MLKPEARKFRWRLTDQRLSVQFLLAGGIVAAFSIASIVLLLQQVDSQTKASGFLSQAHRAVAKLNTLGRDFNRQESALLDHLRTGDPRELAAFREGRARWDEGYQAIEALVSTASPAARDAELLRRVDVSYRGWARVADALLARPAARAGREALLRDEVDRFRATLGLIDQLIGTETQQLAVRDEKEKNATSTTFIAIAVINVVLLVVFGIALAELYFSIASPIAALSEGMGRYRGGDFKARVPVSNESQIGFLQRSFNDMAEKIEAMVADLRKLDVMKSEFISTVSHELRTPLTSIGGYAKLLAAGDAGPVTDTQREFLYIIDTNVVRLTHLINDILDLDKLELGKMEIEREPQDLAAVLKDCRDTFGIVASQKGLELRYRVASPLPAVLGDYGRLVQLFMNLLSNAIKYTPRGFVEVEAEASEIAITVRVRDSGVGLTEEEREKLFQKFYRTRSGLASAEGGTGLGLVIVRGLVEAHGGTIGVESEPGQGTCFTVTIPAASPAEPDAGIVQIEPEPGAGVPEVPSEWQRPVWIVDADGEAVARMSRIIEDAGPLFHGYRLRVQSFASVDDLPAVGPTTMKEGAPFMVILDPRCPRKSSRDPRGAVARLRQRLHRTVPVLVVSSSIDTVEALAEGASALLAKPIDEREFLAAVRELVAAKGWRVLVAERSTDLRILLKRAFEQRGFIVDDVDRGSEVLGRLEQAAYDLALLDMSFKDVPALDLLKAIRRGDQFPTLPVFVMLSEDRRAPSAAELAAWGATASVGKERGIGGVVDAVCHHLEDRKLKEVE